MQKKGSSEKNAIKVCVSEIELWKTQAKDKFHLLSKSTCHYISSYIIVSTLKVGKLILARDWTNLKKFIKLY